ncbi:AI-2E family transporter [Alkalilacustris brevis]|uniref:AI-2E family transporter n=1 Tax=Alkalilacustris brevis TaxID=2026338 RepID=UPI0013905E11|nr:AI-2E family transporter [Alkalilacustris brevis]
MSDDRLQPAPTQPHREASAGWFSRLDRGALQTLLLGIIAGVVILAALDAASLIAVPMVLALLCAIALAPAVRWLEHTRAPASLCAALVVGGLLFGAATTVYSLAPSAEAWNERAPQVLREMERRAREIVSGLSDSFDAGPGELPSVVAGQPPPADPPALADDTVGRLVEGGQRLLADWAIGAPRLAAGAAFWAALTFFLLRDRVMLARWGMSLVPGVSARRAVGRAMRDVRTNVARYLLAITAVNLGLGVCTAAAFYLLGVANAPLWGVAAALLNFMPFIGVAIMALVTLGVGVVSFEDPIIAFAPFAVIVGLNIIEAQFVTPMVVGARIRIAPIGVFLGIAFGAWLWGAAGALVATPTLIVAAAFVRRLNAAAHLSKPSRQHEFHEEGRDHGERPH